MTRQHDTTLLEIPAVFAILVTGAVLRYWLSTAVPFDASEFEALFGAGVRGAGVRVPFIMFNGISLLMFYLIVRRSAGVAAAIALLLAVQTSLAFQEQALRLRWPSVAIMIGMLVLTYWRHTLPGWRAPRAAAVALSLLAAMLAMRVLYLGVTLPTRLEEIRRETTGDAAALYASLVACGGGESSSLETLRGCKLVWPTTRSLEQQEALLFHQQTLSTRTSAYYADGPLAEQDPTSVAVFDFDAAAFFIVADREMEAIARRVVGPVPASASHP
ncbi:MAG: hypothetical protein GY944_15645 [bacterium]|nr:hypothetical protein [bacterium]